MRGQTLPAHELILVVDHNPDLHLKLKDAYRDAIVMENIHEQGLSGGRNTGVATATGDVVAFLDDDAVAAPGWLAAFAEQFGDPAVTGVGGLTRPLWATGARPRWFPEEFNWVVGCSYRGMPTGARADPQRDGRQRGLPPRGDRRGRRLQHRDRAQRAGPQEQAAGVRGDRVLHPADPAAARHGADVRAGRGDRPQGARRHGASSLISAAGATRRACPRPWSTHSVGATDGLATERGYTFKTLPLGVLRGLRDALRGDPAGSAGPARS